MKRKKPIQFGARAGQCSARAGFSLIEMLIGVSVMALLSTMIADSIGSLRRMTLASETRMSLQVMANETLTEMVDELRLSGELLIGAKQYPHVFDAGVPGPEFILHAHAPASGEANPGDPDFGPDREVVFLLPRDADADGRPDINADGSLAWGADEVSFTVVTRANGINVLERRVNGGPPSVVGHHVERLLIDTATSSAFAIPLESLRIRIFYRQIDSNGHLILYSNEAVLALRNG